MANTFNHNGKVVITDGGNVGIGTTSPSRKLIVYDTDANVPTIGLRTDGSGTATGDGFDLQFASSNTFLFNRESGYMSFGTDNTERVRITSAGNVGIGTTSPNDGKLQVFSNSSSNWGIYAFNQNTNGIGLHVETNSYGTEQLLRLSSLSGAGGTNTVKMVVRADGNVGIGTTSPGYKLDVSSDTNDGNIIRSTNLNAGAAASARFYAENNIGSLGQLTTYSSGFGFTVFDLAAGNFSALLSSGASSAGLLIGSLTSSPVVFGTNNTERMRITSGGNVGIGTTSPTSIGTGITSLDIQGSNAGGIAFGPSGTKNYIYGASTMYVEAHTTAVFVTSGTEKMRITAAGNVGIGTTSPNALLHVYGTNTSVLSSIVENTSSATGAYAGYTIKSDYAHSYLPGLLLNSSTNTAYAGVDQLMLYQFHSKPISLVTNNIVRLMVSGAGDVGIGTTAPNQKLQVNGFVNATGYVNSGTTFIKSFNIGNISAGATFALGRLNFESVYTHHFRVTITSYYGSKTFDFIGYQTSLNKTVSGISGGGDVVIETILDASSQVTGVKIGITTGVADYVYTANVECLSTFLSWEDYSSSTTITPTSIGYTNSSFAIGGGSVGIGTTSPASESSLTLGAKSASEGGHLTLQKGTSQSNATHIDNFGNTFRIMGGSDSASGGVQFLLDHSAGNVGIGTTSPGAKLDVAGDIRLGGTATYNSVSVYNNSASGGGGYLAYQNGVVQAFFGAAGWYTGTTDTGVVIGTDSSSRPIRFYTDTERMRITGDGNVGIGTTSPGAKLHVVGTESRFGGVASGYISVYNANSRSGYLQANEGSDFRIASDTNDMTFYVNGSERMRITAAGNVGIGTTSPSTNLHVAGSVRVSGNNTNRLDLDGGVRITGQYYANGNTEYTYIDMYNNANASINIGTKHPLSYISFESGNGAYTERMRITNTGNVGIGTTAPVTQLQVTSATNAVDVLRIGNTAGDSGSVQGVTHLAINHFNAGTNPSTRITAYQDGVSGWPGGMYFSTRSLNTDSAPVERMRITSGGNVGIGTTSPSNILHITNVMRMDNATGNAPAVTSYTPRNGYGDVETERCLADPAVWLKINIGGTEYVIPAYTQA